MKDNIPVSVIIPCYNCADTIERAVDSVYKQTFRPKEVILVDDCSSDNGITKQKLIDLQKRYSKEWIKVVFLEKNRGPGYARNVGWEMAEGDYIAFLDADDSWHPKKIEIQYQWMKENTNVSLSGHSTIQITSSSDRIIGMVSEKYKVSKITKGKLLLSNLFPTRSVMLKKNLRFRFNDHKRYSEDYLLWLEIVLNDNDAYFISLPLAYSFKRDFGDSGLSGRLWLMEKGELNTYQELYKKKLIRFHELIFYSVISLLKFSRRIILSLFKQNSIKINC